MKFRKKPVEVEAFLFNGSNFSDVEEFTEGKANRYDVTDMVIYTLEGRMIASAGDWIIRGVHGEYYPCKPDIFDKTYEPVNE